MRFATIGEVSRYGPLRILTVRLSLTAHIRTPTWLRCSSRIWGCAMKKWQLSQAAEYYSQADAYWAVIGSIELRAVSLNCKGVVQHLMGQYEAAAATLQRALQFAREAAVPDYEATVLADLGNLFSDLQLWSRPTRLTVRRAIWISAPFFRATLPWRTPVSSFDNTITSRHNA